MLFTLYIKAQHLQLHPILYNSKSLPVNTYTNTKLLGPLRKILPEYNVHIWIQRCEAELDHLHIDNDKSGNRLYKSKYSYCIELFQTSYLVLLRSDPKSLIKLKTSSTV